MLGVSPTNEILEKVIKLESRESKNSVIPICDREKVDLKNQAKDLLNCVVS